MKDTLGQFLMRWRIRTVLPHIRGRLLDIGCGTNALTKAYGASGVGVDVHQWGAVDVVVDDSAHLPFDDRSFDTVTIIASLNHIPNRREVLVEAHRILVAGGVLVLTMIPPGISRVWHRIREPWDVDQKERGMKDGEVFGLTRAETHLLLKEAGFQVQHEERFMGGINRLTVARKPSRL